MPLSPPLNPASTALLPAAALIVGAAVLTERYWRQRSPVIHFLVRLTSFAVLTALMLASGIAPYAPAPATSEPVRFLSAALELVWWSSAAWFAVGFLRAFVLFGGRPREAKLVQDLLAAVIYVAVGVAIAANVFDLPIKGLLATSGALAIIIGLALQSSLGDVFSGIVLNIERPYRAGDWIILDQGIEGQVIETNWRATHILTGRQDVAIVPNSVIAKLRIVNCSAPSPRHGVSLRVRLEPSISPAMACELLTGVLLGVRSILQAPPPKVNVRDLSAEALELELSYSVADIGQADAAQNEIFERLYRATAAAGIGFSPRLSSLAGPTAPAARLNPETMPQRLVAGVALFAGLSAEEKKDLAGRMVRRAYKPGAVVVSKGTVTQALHRGGRGARRLVGRGRRTARGRPAGVRRLFRRGRASDRLAARRRDHRAHRRSPL